MGGILDRDAAAHCFAVNTTNTFLFQAVKQPSVVGVASSVRSASLEMTVAQDTVVADESSPSSSGEIFPSHVSMNRKGPNLCPLQHAGQPKVSQLAAVAAPAVAHRFEEHVACSLPPR